ncbi:MAG: uroporphyrinogen decarboxylase [Chloroflexota bacterium]
MNDTFLKACRGEKVPYTPIWIMRQAGRFLPEYRAIQKKTDFMTMCKTPDLAAEVTLLPIKLLGVDAAIFFSDILTTVEPMGMDLKFFPDKGPIFMNPIRTTADIDRLVVPDPEEELAFVPKAVKILVKELSNKVPLIGFAGAPFTMAAFMVEGAGSPRYLITKRLLFEEPKAFHKLLEKVTKLTTAYMKSQINAGAPAVMLFDTCAGQLGPVDYAEFNLPYVQKIVKALKSTGVPIVYYANGCGGLAELVGKSGADVIGVDWRISLAQAVKRLGKNVTVQGNLEPQVLFSNKKKIKERVKEVLSGGSGARGHIFNLGDGILPDTPVENVRFLINTVHRLSRQK